MKPGISSITLGVDPTIITRGTVGRETSSTANLLNKFEVHLGVKLLRLCDALLPTNMVLSLVKSYLSVFGKVS